MAYQLRSGDHRAYAPEIFPISSGNCHYIGRIKVSSVEVSSMHDYATWLHEAPRR